MPLRRLEIEGDLMSTDLREGENCCCRRGAYTLYLNAGPCWYFRRRRRRRQFKTVCAKFKSCKNIGFDLWAILEITRVIQASRLPIECWDFNIYLSGYLLDINHQNILKFFTLHFTICFTRHGYNKITCKILFFILSLHEHTPWQIIKGCRISKRCAEYRFWRKPCWMQYFSSTIECRYFALLKTFLDKVFLWKKVIAQIYIKQKLHNWVLKFHEYGLYLHVKDEIVLRIIFALLFLRKKSIQWCFNLGAHQPQQLCFIWPILYRKLFWNAESTWILLL